ncbi:MAG: DUF2951 family protein [Methanobrevibacter arboriphilus]|uniref:DUF2951 family protein n=1 Tax=Methanobrevibacter arboriphilus TaxID=39441 RepID=A0A843AMS8_METAZ|nr:DUF2951 family protein [Methanobrevibacter arboriphilus]MBF4468130.1 DUF2951 family protein [Methanobrevibacter arboriphilus]
MDDDIYYEANRQYEIEEEKKRIEAKNMGIFDIGMNIIGLIVCIFVAIVIGLLVILFL